MYIYLCIPMFILLLHGCSFNKKYNQDNLLSNFKNTDMIDKVISDIADTSISSNEYIFISFRTYNSFVSKHSKSILREVQYLFVPKEYKIINKANLSKMYLIYRFDGFGKQELLGESGDYIEVKSIVESIIKHNNKVN